MLINKELNFEKLDEYLDKDEKAQISNWLTKISTHKFSNGKTYYQISGLKQSRTLEQFLNHLYLGKVVEFFVYKKLKEYGIYTTKPALIIGSVDNGDLVEQVSLKKISIKYSKFREESWLINKYDSLVTDPEQIFVGLRMNDNMEVAIRLICKSKNLKNKLKAPRCNNFSNMYAVYFSDFK